ncbi:MAG: tRNA dihydrouridine(20/20a) synthase DusA [Legionellaceae bacterium]|nr:tRNA dihydrouridine(20/20a) synthase DusA [Legionellaceae bacterium]
MVFCSAPLFSPLSIAPMIDWTHVPFRMLMRLLAPEALLYTEMQTTNAILHNPRRALDFHPAETPVAMQLGGSDPEALAIAAKQAEDAGFSEINLNLGCPSDRVISGNFGACLMRSPEQVAECMAAMKAAVGIPVTAKTRIGVDHDDSYDFFQNFVAYLVDAGCDKLIVHARKAWLTGLNPKQNRTIPPIQYDYVYRIKTSLPQNIPVVINGHIESIEAIQAHLKHVDGVMIGRLACRDPYAIAKLHHDLYPAVAMPSRTNVLQDYFAYAQSEHAQHETIHRLFKPILNLVHGLPGARAWKAELLKIQRIEQKQDLEALVAQLAHMEQS